MHAFALPAFNVPTITFGWSWEDRSFGYTAAFAELGMTALIIGPLFVEFDWGI
jgi:hypothetical protein